MSDRQRALDGWVFAALCHWAERNGGVICGKQGATITLHERNEAMRPLGTVVVQASKQEPE